MTKGISILVVEDETIVALEIESRLTKLGYRVVSTATSGEEAVEKAEHYKPGLVLMDINLEGDMDGTEAAEAIRDKYNIPVIYLTAYSDDETLKRAKITEPFAYILKPFGERDLYTAIETALYRHKVETELELHRNHLEKLVESRNSELKLLLRQQTEVSDRYNACSVLLRNHISSTENLIRGIRENRDDCGALKEIASGKVIDNVGRGIGNISEIFSLLQKISRPGYIRETEVDLYEQVRNSVLLFTMEGRNAWIRVENDFPDSPRFFVKGVRLDMQSLFLSVLNFIREGILKHYEDITEESEVEAEPYILITGGGSDETVNVRIFCSGINISSEKTDPLTEPVNEVSHSVSDISCYSLRELVGKMNVNFRIDDSDGAGTAFNLNFSCLGVLKEVVYE